MGMTMTEKIFARASGRSQVRAGEIVTAKIDLAMIQDALGPIVYSQFRELDIPVWDTDKVVVAIDHFCLPGTMENAVTIDSSARFADDYGISHFFDMQGVSHQMIVERGMILPGQVAVGTDSHTCTYGALGAFSTGIGSTEMCGVLASGELWFKVPQTILVRVEGELPPYVTSKDIMLKLLSITGANGATYKTLEFTGSAIRNLSMEARFTLTNMAIEAGAKNGIIAADEKTAAYLAAAGVSRSYSPVYSDDDAVYCREITIDASALVPQVAVPFSPANVVDITEKEGTALNQVIIGACTNGRLEDLKIAAEIITGKKIPRGLRCYIVPASNRVYVAASRCGCLADLAEAGCIIVNPGCGGCGIQMPMVAGEACMGTHNRNFCGRMGSPDALVYLASPVTAAVSALRGEITDPRRYFAETEGGMNA